MERENIKDYIVTDGNISVCIVVEPKNNSKTHIEKYAEVFEALQKGEE